MIASHYYLDNKAIILITLVELISSRVNVNKEMSV